ncbi:MAG: hypothetical protein N3B16_06165 [Candidatus Aminicenantes bacterium]|nr:hypothetical protein [Candidatus Aminicenantes bacterium]
MISTIQSIVTILLSVIAIILSIIFYFKSTRRLQAAVNVIGTYLEQTIKDSDVRLHRNRKGDVIGIVITLHPQPGYMLSTGKSTTLQGDK